VFIAGAVELYGHEVRLFIVWRPENRHARCTAD
jgi:hypothetical protein